MTHSSPLILRRLGTMLYDGILVFALWIIGTIPLLLFTHGKTIPPGNLFYQLYLFLLTASFYIWFWTHGGQTAGMAAWRLRLISNSKANKNANSNMSSNSITFKQAILRFLLAIPSLACAGLGLWWAIWDKEKQTLYDRFSESRVTLIN